MSTVLPAGAPPTAKPPVPRLRRWWQANWHLKWRYYVLALVLIALGAGATLSAERVRTWFHRRTPLSPTEQQWQQAQEALGRDDFEAARLSLEECVRVWPMNAEAHFALARTCRREAAFLDWRIHHALSLFHQPYIADMQAERTKRMDQFRTQLHWAALLRWPIRDIRLEERLILAQDGGLVDHDQDLIDFANASPGYEDAIMEAVVEGYVLHDRLENVTSMTSDWMTSDWSKRHPNRWLPLLYRGIARLQWHATADARADFEHVLELEPTQLEARVALASLDSFDGEYKSAVQEYERCLKDHPTDPQALFGLADCQNALGHTDDALKTLDRLFAKYNDHPGAELLRGRIETAAGHLEVALPWLRRAVALAPSDMEVVQSLWLVLSQLKQTKEADRYWKQWKELEKLGTQLARIKETIVKHPTDVEARYQAAELCLRMGLEKESAHWFQTVLDLDPNHRATHRALAKYWDQHGDPKRAAYHRRRAGD